MARPQQREELSEEARLASERKRKAELDDLRNVLGTDSGYRLISRLLGYCRAFESVWSPSAEIHRNCGRQDVGHWVLGEVIQADAETVGRIFTEIKRDLIAAENLKAKEAK